MINAIVMAFLVFVAVLTMMPQSKACLKLKIIV